MRSFTVIIPSFRRLALLLVAVPLLFMATVGASDCDSDKGPTNNRDQAKSSVQIRGENFARAEAMYPMPQQTNFPMREALVKYTQRQDLKAHPWYIYVQIGEQSPSYLYYIGQTYPQSTCNFLGSTEDIVNVDLIDNNAAAVKITAPSLDGVFYGGGGSNGGGCDYFFFDMATDGLIVLHHEYKWFVSERVLGTLDARPVRVTTN